MSSLAPLTQCCLPFLKIANDMLYSPSYSILDSLDVSNNSYVTNNVHTFYTVSRSKR